MSSRLIKRRRRKVELDVLTDKQRLFVASYLASAELNGAKAAREAGYACSATAASKLLADSNVCAAVSKAIYDRIHRTGITQDAVIEHLTTALYLDPLEFFAPGEDGGYVLKESLDDVPQHIRRCVKKFRVKTKTYTNRATGDTESTTYVEVELMDKDNMMVLALRHLGLLRDKVSHEHSGKVSMDWNGLLQEVEQRRNIIQSDVVEEAK